MELGHGSFDRTPILPISNLEAADRHFDSPAVDSVATAAVARLAELFAGLVSAEDGQRGVVVAIVPFNLPSRLGHHGQRSVKVRADSAGGIVVRGDVGGAIDDHVRLSEREFEVLELVSTGSTNFEIADALCIAPATVIRHVSNIYSKTGVTNRAEATAYAIRRRLAE